MLLIDTAGRLHNKKNLMEELRKMNRIIDREYPDAHRENLIVLDGTTGQNALVHAHRVYSDQYIRITREKSIIEGDCKGRHCRGHSV